MNYSSSNPRLFIDNYHKWDYVENMEYNSTNVVFLEKCIFSFIKNLKNNTHLYILI